MEYKKNFFFFLAFSLFLFPLAFSSANQFQIQDNKLKPIQQSANSTPNSTVTLDLNLSGPCAGFLGIDKIHSADQLNKEIKKTQNEISTLSTNKTETETTTQTGSKKTSGLTEEAKASINSCNEKQALYQDALNKLNQCTETIEKVLDSKTAFQKSCAGFSGGTTRCVSAIDACDKCPDAEDDEDNDCVSVHKKTKCPALAGKELEEAKEKRKELDEEIKTLKGDIEEKEKDLLSKEEDLKDEIAEIENDFRSTTRELERETEEAKSSLEEGLKTAKSQIEEQTAKQLANVQEQIDIQLKVAHTFENAIYKANREYRAERRGITMQCEAQAKADLAKYRMRRRAAIETGSLSFSLSNFLQMGRTSFANQDIMMFQQYKKSCLARRKEDFKEASQAYQQQLRIIDQQREQYLDTLRKQKQRLAMANQQAHKSGNQLLQDYRRQMDTALTNHNKQYGLNVQNYRKMKGAIASKTRSLGVLERQVQRDAQSLQIKDRTMLREEAMVNYLKSKGTPTGEDTGTEFLEAATNHKDLAGQLEIARTKCGCSPPDSKDSKDSNLKPNQSKCNNEIKKAADIIGPSSTDSREHKSGGSDR